MDSATSSRAASASQVSTTFAVRVRVSGPLSKDDHCLNVSWQYSRDGEVFLPATTLSGIAEPSEGEWERGTRMNVPPGYTMPSYDYVAKVIEASCPTDEPAARSYKRVSKYKSYSITYTAHELAAGILHQYVSRFPRESDVKYQPLDSTIQIGDSGSRVHIRLDPESTQFDVVASARSGVSHECFVQCQVRTAVNAHNSRT